MARNPSKLVEEINDSFPVLVDYCKYNKEKKLWEVEYIELQTIEEKINEEEDMMYSGGFEAKSFQGIRDAFEELFPFHLQDVHLY